MSASVTIWTLESDNDEKAVKCLAEKAVKYLANNKFQMKGNEIEVFIRAVGKPPKQHRSVKDPTEILKRQVDLYLEQDRCVIFVIDADGPISSYQRRQEPNSFINQVERVLIEEKFLGRVYLVEAKQELEAWLLIDCLGIFCYYAEQRKQYEQGCREKIHANSSFLRLINKYQKGNTQLIVEPERGGKGAKEYLVRFSKEVLLSLNPQMPDKNINEHKYRENLSNGVAQHIEINLDTLKRNDSLRNLGELIVQCCKSCLQKV